MFLYFQYKIERKTGLGPATPTYFRLKKITKCVKRRRLELPRHNCHYPLKVARLPIPPPLHYSNVAYINSNT